jgi:Ca2+-binding EF-hand superfamily protein
MILLPFLLLAVQAPAQAPPPAAVAPPFQSRHGGRLFISPMGEPFRAKGRADDGLADWFRQANLNHDGKLTLEEMQKDADRFFAVLDLNHDGEIDPDEIKHYEEVIAPEVRTGEHYDLASLEGTDKDNEGNGGGQGRGHGGGGHRRGGASGGNGGSKSFFHSSSPDLHQGAARYGLLDLPEPVIAADTNFDRGVSLTEFRAAAQARFMALDLDHKGYLTLEGLETIRPAPPPTPNPPESSSDSSDAPPH